jgi:hypothetical protein
MIDTTLAPEHASARLGKLTASRIADATARTAGGKWGASRANYLSQLLVERLTGVAAERFVTKEMLWGIETEAQARAAYQFYHDATIEPSGFVDHPHVPMSGASPDGLIGAQGLIEIKCPNTATHIDFLLTDEVDLKYRKQMCWQLLCTEREWCDFASFDPRMPEPLQLRVRRFTLADLLADNQIKNIVAEAAEFVAELAAKEAALRAQIERREAA